MSLNNEVAQKAHVSEKEMIDFVITSAKEVFSTIIMTNIESQSNVGLETKQKLCGVTGMVGLTGTYSGLISIHCSYDFSKEITLHMLGMTDEEITEDDIHDALGEIANMLAGSIKMILTKGGMDVKLSVPTIISGTDYTFDVLSEENAVVVPFIANQHEFLIGLNLNKEE